MLAILCSASPREEYSWVRRHGSCATAKNKWHQYVSLRHAPPHTSTLGRISREGKQGEAVPSNLDSRRKHCFRPAWCSCCVTRILAEPCSSFGTAPARKPPPNQGLPKMVSNTLRPGQPHAQLASSWQPLIERPPGLSHAHF